MAKPDNLESNIPSRTDVLDDGELPSATSRVFVELAKQGISAELAITSNRGTSTQRPDFDLELARVQRLDESWKRRRRRQFGPLLPK